MILFYVDDVIVIGDNLETIERLKSALNEWFRIKDLENLKYFLGMKVVRSKEGISMCQRRYAIDLLTKVRIIRSKPSKIPLKHNLRLSKNEGELLSNPVIYRRLVGKQCI